MARPAEHWSGFHAAIFAAVTPLERALGALWVLERALGARESSGCSREFSELWFECLHVLPTEGSDRHTPAHTLSELALNHRSNYAESSVSVGMPSVR